MTDPAAMTPEPEALVDFTAFDDGQMRLLARQVRDEINRRDLFAAAPQMLQDVLTTYQGDQGAPGDPWVQPQGALTSYPSGWEVAHGGKVWRSLVSGNVWEPGVSGWREQVPEGQDPPEWVQPTGAHDAYGMGERVTYDGEVWFSTRDANVHPPPEGWALEDPPEHEPGPDPEVMPWEAGISYQPGDRVSYEGIVYECRQAHTAQTGWEPPNIPSLWLAA